jgi:hypothetical protein
MRTFLPIVLITSAPTSPVTLILGEAAGENLITIHSTINSSLSDSSTTIYPGTIEADLTLVEQAGLLKGLSNEGEGLEIK